MKILSFLFIIVLVSSYPSRGQVQFVQRMELDTNWEDMDFIILTMGDGLVGLRMISGEGMRRERVLQYFTADHQLGSKELKQLPVKDFHHLLGFDLDGDLLYVLLQKGDTPSAEKLILEINLINGETLEIPMDAILNMELQEFFVLNRQAIFMGNMDYRPAIQVFNITNQHLTTIQGIYERDTRIIQMQKAPELGAFDVLISRRDRLRNKVISLISFDMEGNKLKEVKIDHLPDPQMEIMEGVLTHTVNYSQALIGQFGLKRRDSNHGLFLTKINEFGEYESHLYTLADFENFYDYLPEKARERRLRRLERRTAREKPTPIGNSFSTREIIWQDGTYLVYNDHFTSSSGRYRRRDGIYINNFYRMSPMVSHWGGYGNYYSPLWTSPYLRAGQFTSEYRFISAQFVLLNENGAIKWDSSLSLENSNRTNPGKFGEISFDGSNLFYLYMDGVELKLSQISDGEVVMENETFELELIRENERIQDTQENSLNLLWWYQDYYLLTGKQRIRYQNEEGRENQREVFFLSKIKAGPVGDLN